MKAIDFDRKFQQFALDWIRSNPDVTEDEVDQKYNDLLAQWRELPADWLGGLSPAHCFDSLGADDLVGLLMEYTKVKIDVPEPLYSRIIQVGKQCEAALARLAADEGQCEPLRATAISLLMEMGSALPVETCAGLIAHAGEDGALTEVASRLLERQGARIVELILNHYRAATGFGQDIFLDILCNFPGDERIYNSVMQKLIDEPDSRALHAAQAAKLGDDRAIGPLERLAELSELSYLDYLEIVNAIEALGGEVLNRREFYGDADYEALRLL